MTTPVIPTLIHGTMYKSSRRIIVLMLSGILAKVQPDEGTKDPDLSCLDLITNWDCLSCIQLPLGKRVTLKDY